MANAIQPMEQFLVHKLVPLQPLQIGDYSLDLSITNSTAMMMTAALVVCAILGLASRGELVPGRLQAVGETLFDLIDGVLVGPIIGEKGRPYLAFIFTIFMMVLVMNLLGVILAFGNVGGLRWTFTPTAQLAVTGTLAILTFLSVIVIGFLKNGIGFFKLFVPSGMPWPMLLLVVPIELLSFLIRPLTLAMRLFGNMLGGHVVMYIFGSFVVMLGLIGATGGLATLGYLGSGLSFAMVVALTGLELVVAGLQAFVFAALATVYLSEVVNLGHGH
jgi:F-type H+-transporting ATPase subunit a